MQTDVASKSGGKRLKGLSAPSSLDCPLITIVTPVFNGDKELEASILSVLNQEYRNIEYIIIDGGSTDGTLEILRKYEESIDYWVSEPDRGIYDAMNKAIGLAHGRWVYFLGSDDTLCGTLALVADCLEDEEVIYYGNVYLTGTKRLSSGPFGPWRLLRKNICQQAIFYPRALFESRQFSMKYALLADWEFILRCYADPNFRLQHLPVVVANYNNVSGASSVRADAQFAIDQSEIIRECLPGACYVWHRLKGLAHIAINSMRGER